MERAIRQRDTVIAPRIIMGRIAPRIVRPLQPAVATERATQVVPVFATQIITG